MIHLYLLKFRKHERKPTEKIVTIEAESYKARLLLNFEFQSTSIKNSL